MELNLYNNLTKPVWMPFTAKPKFSEIIFREFLFREILFRV
jgi:hypothetical protein